MAHTCGSRAPAAGSLYLPTSLIRASTLSSESRKNVIHKSWVGIFRDNVRLVLKANAFGLQLAVSHLNIGHSEIQDGAGVVELRLVGMVQ